MLTFYRFVRWSRAWTAASLLADSDVRRNCVGGARLMRKCATLVICHVYLEARAEFRYHSTVTVARSSESTANVVKPVVLKPELRASCVWADRNINIISCVGRYARKYLSNTRHLSWRSHHTMSHTKWVRVLLLADPISHHWYHISKSGKQVQGCMEVPQPTKANDQTNI